MRLVKLGLVCAALVLCSLAFGQEEGAAPPRGERPFRGEGGQGRGAEIREIFRQMREIQMQLRPVYEQLVRSDPELLQMKQEMDELQRKLQEKRAAFEEKLMEKITASFPDYKDLVDQLQELRNKLKEMRPQGRFGPGMGGGPGADRGRPRRGGEGRQPPQEQGATENPAEQ